MKKMISPKDLYTVLTAVVPLYVPMILGYASVKWWKIVSPEQCSGINRFVAVFAVPFLSFHFISSNNPYAMNYRFVAADTLQKIVVLAFLAVWSRTSARGSLEWSITLFSLSAIPNTLVMGIPLLKAMYGNDDSGALMVQIVVLQCIIWCTLLLFLFEYRAARLLIAEQFPDNNAAAGSIISFQVDPELADEIGVRKSAASSSPVSDVVGADHETDTTKQGPGVETKPTTMIMPPTRVVMTRLILIMVWRKLIRNPNTYSTLFGLTWSLISFKWHVAMPAIIDNSVSILSDTGLGMAMFSLGMFMALQPRIIACGKSVALKSMAVRFLAGPAVMAAASIAVGLRGVELQIAIVQAALPQGIVTFVFAKEYNVHPDILSTGVIFGMLVALPITLVYFILLGTVI